ncbi:MAG: ribonuclease HII [Bdellovibrionales bacterium]|nr:ribonuclease HII [Bdellovibrionales bacterium]
MELIAGVDEAGRGPLAGPVVAAACVLKPNYVNPDIKDSKKFSKKKREKIFEDIIVDAVDWAIAVISHQVIDEINILEATKTAMQTVLSLVQADKGLIDGNVLVPANFPVRAVVKGDAKHIEISAASILAKVHRDKLMSHLDSMYPQYGFKLHSGYPTKFHKEAIKKYGPSPIHRKSFRGVKEFLYKPMPLVKNANIFNTSSVIVSFKSKNL